MGQFSTSPPSSPGGRSMSGRAVMPFLVGLLLIFVPARPAASAGGGDQPSTSGSQGGDEAQDRAGQAARKEKTDKKPSATATPTPPLSASPAASPTPAAPPAPGSNPPRPPRSGAERPTPPPALSLTDDDLNKYHGARVEEEATEDDEPAGPQGPPAPPGLGAGADPVPPPGSPAGSQPARKRRPKPAPVTQTAPPEDPLKSSRDREAMEKFRADQIQALRDKIAQAQARLDYLKAKREAIQNPAPLQVGHTRAPGKGPAPVMGFFPSLPPAQTDEDKEKDATLKPKELLAQVEEEIATAEEDLAKLQQDLVRVETRAQREKEPR